MATRAARAWNREFIHKIPFTKNEKQMDDIGRYELADVHVYVFYDDEHKTLNFFFAGPFTISAIKLVGSTNKLLLLTMSTSKDDRKRSHDDDKDASDPNKKIAAKDRSYISELQGLLLPLGERTSLASLTPASLDKKQSPSEKDPVHKTVLEDARNNQLLLFDKHIGPYTAVIGCAQRHVQALVLDGVYCNNTGCEKINRYVHPSQVYIAGPNPDPCVWLGMFLGRSAEEEARAREKETRKGREVAYAGVYKDLKQTVPALPVLELASNILRYVDDEGRRLKNSAHLLRFCAVYGLSGTMGNVLKGLYRYGPVQGLSIDTCLSANDPEAEPAVYEEEDIPGRLSRDLYLPVCGIGAVLGHTHVVEHAIQSLGADINANLLFKMANREHDVEQDAEDPASPMLLTWAILSNQPEMVKCLVLNAGVQFRWIADEMRHIFQVLFHIDRTGDEFGVWRSAGYDPTKYTGGKEEQRLHRAQFCYKEKVEMLKTLIEVGLPQALLIPQIDTSLDAKITKEASDKGMAEPDAHMMRIYYKSLTRTERKARDQIYDACSFYNSVCKEEDTVTVEDFINKYIAGLWKEQPVVQEVRLQEPEALDFRWDQFESKGEKAFEPWWVELDEMGESEESDDDSEDEDDDDDDGGADLDD
jgi:hypothetical protein